jgi:hypothetical protein
MTSLAPSPTREKPGLRDFLPREGIDQPLGFPSEAGDHPDAQGLRAGTDAAVDATAEEHLHPDGL